MRNWSRKAALHCVALAATLLLVSCGGSDSVPAPPALFSKVYVFGASLSDTGNACKLAAVNCPPSPPYAAGKYSNGPLYVELLAARYSATVTPSLNGGTNYAYAGARTAPIAGTTQTVPDMGAQLNTYLAANAFVSLPQYLYVVDAGTVGNDIGDALVLGQTNPTAPTTILTNAVTSIATIINRLYASGARQIFLLNSPNIGATPRVQALGATAIAGATQLSQQFNGALAQQVAAIRAISPGLNIYVLDAYALGVEVSANATALGFTNTTQACFNSLVTPPTLCTTPDTYFYWDPFHPTAATGRLVYARAAAAIGI